MLQRCCMCLSGVAQELGSGGVAPTALLRPSAEKYLKERAAAKK